MTIQRLTETDYAVITTVVLADGSFRADYCCALEGNVLKSQQRKGVIRVGGLMKVTILNEDALSQIRALKVGETLTR